MSMMNELKALSALMHHDQHSQYANPNRVASDYADRLDDIIRKYEEPSEAMVHAGAEVLAGISGHPVAHYQEARACFKAMMNAED